MTSALTTDLNYMLPILEEEFPHSLPVFHCLRSALRGAWGEIGDMKVDMSATIENLSILCHTPSLVPTIQGQKESYLYTHSVDPDVVKSFIQQPGTIDWHADNHCFLMTFIPKKQDFLPLILKECVNVRGYQVRDEGRCCMCIYSTDTKKTKSTIPRGLKMGQLSPVHVQYVTASWKFSTPYTVTTIRRNIEVFPSCAIFEEASSEPVCWAMVKAHGGIGLEHTMDKYRKKKLQKRVLRELVAQITKKGDIPFVFVQEDNVPLLKAYKKLGFTEVIDCAFTWIKFSKNP
ncbi:uncharacterized protein LOC102808100 [Saccoglossus kowalevskii]|uniref:Uncharacterized protein LOC102808100 n=1 Tax=Saccoglossus kowalevskii TaxID=10224 RepID=A0ABM0MFW1_SACKO|nr:PREDICTED: uncharacterized protein LOC102808100 [Saccoglossus kowalevskii]